MTTHIKIPLNDQEIDKNFMQDVLNLEDKEIVVEEVRAERGTEKGENFSSDIYRAHVRLCKKDKIINTSYIIKLGSRDGSRGNAHFEIPIYITEISTYETVLCRMKKLAGNIMEMPFPESVYTTTDAVAGLLVLQDLKPQGYTMAKEKFTQSLDETMAAMGAYSRFHALGYKLKFSTRSPLKETFPDLCKNFWVENRDEMLPLFESGLKTTKTIVSKLLPQYQNKLESLQQMSNKLNGIFDQMESNLSKLSTVVHGDTNSNNVLFKSNESGQVVDCKLVDFEICNFNFPYIDICNYIYSNTSPSIRMKHLEEILRFYHDGLIRNLKLLKVTELSDEELCYEKFYSDFQRCSLSGGIFMTLATLPFYIILHTDVSSLYGGDLLKNFAEAVGKIADQDPESYKFVKSRVEDLMEEMVQLGVI